MFSSKFRLACILAILACAFISCSKSNPATNPISTQLAATTPSTPSTVQNNHYLLGYFLIKYNPADGSAKIIPVRDTATHWNVLKFLEQGPCTNCLKVTGVTTTPEYTKKIDVEIRHPFPNDNLTGFDVRGIVMFNGSCVFPLAGLVMSDRNAGEGELVNPDGYTSLYNPTTAGSGPGGLQGYTKGKFATPTAPNTTLNGYKRYVSPDPANTRNAFYAGATLVSSFDIDMPWYEFVLGYAIDASWAPPTVKPVTDPMTDFPPEANCAEPWQVSVEVSTLGPGLTEQGGEAKLTIEVYDWQGYTSHQAPIIECPDLFTGIKVADFLQDYADHSTWEVTVGNEKLAGSGDHRCLIKVVDNADLTAPAWLDLTAYQVATLAVGEVGWSRTWGGAGIDWPQSVTVDNQGNAYVTGNFGSSVDFDPGSGTDTHVAVGSKDAFLSKFDSSGAFKWARTWGGSDYEIVNSIWLDNNMNLYLTGHFKGTCDFDPGAGQDNRASIGGQDAFLTRYDSDGNYFWTVTWGGTANDIGKGVGVGVDSTVYVTGYFAETVDFDPGTGVMSGVSLGGADAYISWLTSDGIFKSVITLGGTGNDMSVGIGFDLYKNPCIAGSFSDSVDFDPGLSEQLRTSNGKSDVFLAAYSTTMGYKWANAWGGTGFDSATSVEYDPYMSGFLTTGYFNDVVDFNPGTKVDNHTSVGDADAFVSLIWTDETFVWARTWGGPGYDTCDAAAAQPYNFKSLVVCGRFGGTVDFDPGTGAFNRTSNGAADCYLSNFTDGGNFQWANTWGGSMYEYSWDIAVRQSTGSIYVTGSFMETVNMNPGVDIDYHTSNGEDDVFLSKFKPDGSW